MRGAGGEETVEVEERRRGGGGGGGEEVRVEGREDTLISFNQL